MGIIQSVTRDESSGHRTYTQDDINIIDSIACLSATGMPLEDMRQYLSNRDKGDAGVDAEIALLKTQRRRLKDELSFLKIRRDYVGQHQKLTESDLLTTPIQMGARVYLPTLGRFLNVDLVEGGTDNAYSYVNDPVNNFDLDGNIAWFAVIAAGAYLGFAAGAAYEAIKDPTPGNIAWAAVAAIPGAGLDLSQTGIAIAGGLNGVIVRQDLPELVANYPNVSWDAEGQLHPLNEEGKRPLDLSVTQDYLWASSEVLTTPR